MEWGGGSEHIGGKDEIDEWIVVGEDSVIGENVEFIARRIREDDKHVRTDTGVAHLDSDVGHAGSAGPIGHAIGEHCRADKSRRRGVDDTLARDNS